MQIDDYPSGRRERKKLRTQTEILRAGLELFLSQGFKETTIAQIAHAADVAQSTFFLHFQSKEDLVLSGHELGARALVAELERRDGVDTIEFLRRVTEPSLPPARWDPQLWELRAQVIAAEPALAGEERKRWTEVVRPVLISGLAEDLGMSPDSPEPRLLAGMLIGALLEAPRGDEPESREAAAFLRARYWSEMFDVIGAARDQLRRLAIPADAG